MIVACKLETQFSPSAIKPSLQARYICIFLIKYLCALLDFCIIGIRFTYLVKSGWFQKTMLKVCSGIYIVNLKCLVMSCKDSLLIFKVSKGIWPLSSKCNIANRSPKFSVSLLKTDVSDEVCSGLWDVRSSSFDCWFYICAVQLILIWDLHSLWAKYTLSLCKYTCGFICLVCLVPCKITLLPPSKEGLVYTLKI